MTTFQITSVPAVEEIRLWGVLLRKPSVSVEFLAFAKNGRPAVYWQRSLAEGYLADCAKGPATTGRVVRLKLSIE